MEKKISNRIVAALCIAAVAFCCAFVPVRSVDAAGGIMDYNTVCWNSMAYYNCANAELSALENTPYDHNNPWTALYIYIHHVQYNYYKDLSGCYFFTALAMQNSGCTVVGIDYTDGYGCVEHWSAYAFDGWRQWQNICYK